VQVVRAVKISGLSGVLLVAVVACAHAKPAGTAPHLSDAQLHDEGAIPNVQLARYAKVPGKDYRQEVELTVREEVSGKGFTGRGALAVRPRQALRMVLLGPGGTTAMDKIFRGDEHTKEMPRGIPVPLLRHWVVEPFGGVPVAVHRGCVATDGAVVECAGGFVAFLRRGDAFEVRERQEGKGELTGRAWWLHDGSVTAWLEWTEQRFKEDDSEVVVTKTVHYVSNDPPMTVDVTAGSAKTATLPNATFDDPDLVH